MREEINRQRNLIIGGGLVVAIALLGVGQATLGGVALSQTVRAPVFEADPFGPKPLPNVWI